MSSIKEHRDRNVIISPRLTQFKNFEPKVSREFSMLDQTPTDFKRKDPDSFSLDQENSESVRKLSQVQTDDPASPKLRKLGSFSLEDPKPYKLPPLDGLQLPPSFQVAHNLCKSFSKEMKTVNKINHMISRLDDDLRIQEQLNKKSQTRVDEFFDEVYEVFTKNFSKMTESHKQTIKSKIQQEHVEYRAIHDYMKSHLESLLSHDTFSKILEYDMYNVLNNNLLAETNDGLQSQFTDFLQKSDDFKYGLTPLVKKYKLIEYLTKHHTEKPTLSQSTSRPISPRLSEMKKDPFKPLINIQQELETFISKISSTFSHELPSKVHSNASNVHLIDKIAKTPAKIYMQGGQAGDKSPVSEPAESIILKKRLSIHDVSAMSQTSDQNASFDDRERLEREKDGKEQEKDGKEQEKDNSQDQEPTSPRLGRSHSNSSMTNISASNVVSLTPIKPMAYKVPKKELSSYLGREPTKEPDEINFNTHLVSVHYNLSVGDLIVHEGAPCRITHKEWSFPQDTIRMVNIFTGERYEKKYSSRHHKDVEQILTKKYQMIKISEKYGYYLLMDLAWEKGEQLTRLPKVVDFGRVIEDIQDEIKEAFSTEKRIVVHCMKMDDEDRIVSFKKEWF